MPRVATFTYSDNASMDVNNQKMSINNPMVVFKPAFIPSTFSFAVTIGLTGLDNEATYSLRYIFKQVLSSEILVNTGNIPLPIPWSEEDSAIPLEHRGFLLNMDFRNVVLRREGEYVSEVYLDEQLMGQYPIYAKATEPHE